MFHKISLFVFFCVSFILSQLKKIKEKVLNNSKAGNQQQKIGLYKKIMKRISFLKYFYKKAAIHKLLFYLFSSNVKHTIAQTHLQL